MRCHDCGKDTSEDFKDYFMVKHELWKQWGVGRKLLCMDCFEKRLGRKLTKDDLLPDCLINYSWNPYTKKLLNN